MALQDNCRSELNVMIAAGDDKDLVRKEKEMFSSLEQMTEKLPWRDGYVELSPMLSAAAVAFDGFDLLVPDLV